MSSTPERFPSREDASIFVMRRGGAIMGRTHVAISAYQTGGDLRIRFRPLSGWTLDPGFRASAFGLELFGVPFGPVPLPRIYESGEVLKSAPLDLRMVEARVEPAEVTV